MHNTVILLGLSCCRWMTKLRCFRKDLFQLPSRLKTIDAIQWHASVNRDGTHEYTCNEPHPPRLSRPELGDRGSSANYKSRKNLWSCPGLRDVAFLWRLDDEKSFRAFHSSLNMSWTITLQGPKEVSNLYYRSWSYITELLGTKSQDLVDLDTG